MIAIFTYEFNVSKENLNNEGIKVKTLSNYSTLLRIAKKTEYISEIEFKMLEKWNANPSIWI
jgi:orotate phosphoribosyltransferase